MSTNSLASTPARLSEKGGATVFIQARERDLGGFQVRRILPSVEHRLVGPFIFFDHMGPAEFAPGQGLDVRPHPHIHLATVTYLFEGAILHRDSLGSHQLIEPGAINWMTAGKGIVHSERTPDDLRSKGSRVSGIQCWVALPQQNEDREPNFTHYPAAALPEFKVGEVTLRLLIGEAFQQKSPVRVDSDMIYAEARIPRGASFVLPAQDRQLAAYVVAGKALICGVDAGDCGFVIAGNGEALVINAKADSRVMLLGGKGLDGPREIWWNFVSSSRASIEKAKADWKAGKFPRVPEDDREFIPLPELEVPPAGKIPPGTIM